MTNKKNYNEKPISDKKEYSKETISKRLKQIRLERYNTYKEEVLQNKKNAKYGFCKDQTNFALEIGVSRRTYVDWENGNTTPKVKNLVTICNAVDCSMEYFFDTSEIPYSHTVAEISRDTGINPKIIEKAMTDTDYLYGLNLLMEPNTCRKLFNNIQLLRKRKTWKDRGISAVKEPLLNLVKLAFEEFCSESITKSYTINNYRKVLKKYIPENLVCFDIPDKNEKSTIYVKDCLECGEYIKLKKKSQNNNRYIVFINYISDLTYNSLMNEPKVEKEKMALANTFIEFVNDYMNKISG